MHIYLLDLAHTQTVTDHSLTVPLGIAYIKAYVLQEMGAGVTVTLFKHPEEVLARVEEDKPEIVGFSNYGWNRDLNLKVGAHIRTVLPNSLLVAGGPNIDVGADLRIEFLKQFEFLDYGIVAGGEEPFCELAAWWRKAQRDTEDLPENLIWLDAGDLRQTPERPLKKIIENIPSPYLEGHLDTFLERGMVPMLETNRGCPFSCTFCAWGMASQDLVRRFDHQRALAEIEYIGARSKALNWIVCDANFGLLKRDVELAKAIRHVKDTTGFPHYCHVWTAKNTTDRNLEVGKILGDMAVPVMAVQTMADDVLKKIKRSNISTETYIQYLQQFHALGQRTYSDMIVPLPGETLDSHITGIGQLMDFGVDIISNHNMRLLAGAETNSRESREEFNFKTRFRLIHGDAGVYKTATGKSIQSFEYEESLRSTSTMKEEEVFYLRKLHFLVDFCWNLEVYRPLLDLLRTKGVNPITALKIMLDPARASGVVSREVEDKLNDFWAGFDQLSHEEWFDSAEEIEAYFGQKDNFSRLINLEFEKLNILFTVRVFTGYKMEFDQLLEAVTKKMLPDDHQVIDDTMAIVSGLFPPLAYEGDEKIIKLSQAYQGGFEGEVERDGKPEEKVRKVRFYEGQLRKDVKDVILNSEGKTLSKILDSQRICLSQLKFSIDESYGFGRQFKKRMGKTA